MANKGIYDAKDLRTTGGADVNYAMDAAAEGLHARGASARSRRDHLRAGARVRVQRGQRRSGRRRRSRAPVHRARWIARVLGRHDLQPVRHRARDERFERWLGRRRRGEPDDVLDLRDHRRFVPRPGELSGRRADGADEGHDLLRGLVRRQSVSGSSRHHVPLGEGHRDDSRCVPRQEDRQLLRRARSVHGAAACDCVAGAVRERREHGCPPASRSRACASA